MQNADLQIERALALHRAGNARAAEEIYRSVLAAQPDHPDALYLTGCLAHQRGESAAAVALHEQAIAAQEAAGGVGRAEFHYALGSALARLEQLDGAEASLRRAIALGARAEFHTSLGQMLLRQRRLPEAIAELRVAAADDPDAYLPLGKALIAAGDFHAAVEPLHEANKLHPSDLPTLAALRHTLTSASRESEARTLLDQAIASIAQNAAALCDFADALQAAQDLSGAVDIYRRALALGSESAPTQHRALYACGCALLSAGDFAAAIPCFGQALALRPGSMETRHNLARALYEMGDVPAAVEHFSACAASNARGASLARAMLAVIAPGAPSVDNQMVMEIRQAWCKDLRPGTLPEPTAENHRSSARKIRVGYVSSYFHRDNWMKPVWGLINQHDRAQFDVALFSAAPHAAIRHGYRLHADDRFYDVRKLSNKAVAQLIRDAGIDVLVDLNGFSDVERLPLYLLRPAPVILGWFNMYATTGMPCFTALIGDASVIPPQEEVFYTEKILRVRASYLTFSVDYPVPPVAELPCLRSDAGAPFTFGCLGSQYKLTPEVIAAWSRILAAAPASRLLLKNKALGHLAARKFVEAQFAQGGIGSERLLLEGPCDHFDFLKAYDRVDLALDTFPYNGGTTTTEALWQGVPVLAFAGDRWASRTSASLLCAAGLNEFVATHLDGYIARAAHLANTPAEWPALAALRAAMRARLAAAPVCDTKSFAREMEKIYADCLLHAER